MSGAYQQNPRYPKERDRNRQYTFLAKIDGTEVKTATPSEVADTYLSNTDTNRFKEEDKRRLYASLPVEVLTEAQYYALPEPDIETLYVIVGDPSPPELPPEWDFSEGDNSQYLVIM